MMDSFAWAVPFDGIKNVMNNRDISKQGKYHFRTLIFMPPLGFRFFGVYTDGLKRCKGAKTAGPYSLSPPWERAGVRGERAFFGLSRTQWGQIFCGSTLS